MQRFRWAALLLACALLATVAVACQPTGDLRCDAHVDILDEIESHGWSIDCSPDFENKGTRDSGQTWFTIWGWADANRATVWIWPRAVTKGDSFSVRRGVGNGVWHVRDDYMRYLLWHELAHVTGIADETDADRYAWCREPLDVHDQYRFTTTPTDEDCARVGA